MKKNKLFWLISLIVIAITAVIFIPLKADTDKENGMIRADEETLKLVRTIQVWKLVTDVSLSEEQLVSFLPVFKEQSELRWKFQHKKRKIIEELKELVQKENTPENILQEAVDKYDEIENDFYEKMRELDKTLMSKLTPRQQVKYILFQDSYYKELRQTLIKIRELGRNQKHFDSSQDK